MIRLIGSFFLDIIETAVIALSIFLVVYLFIMQPHQVNGNSMYPNYEDGEYLMTDKLSYSFGEPQRGDVVVFHAPQNANCPTGTGCDFIKRIIGIPGDQIEVKGGSVFLNKTKLSEDYLPKGFVTQSGQFTSRGSVVVPPGNYFVMGDNRNHSSDSRAWGFINLKDIVGKAFFRYFPFDRLGVLPQVSIQV